MTKFNNSGRMLAILNCLECMSLDASVETMDKLLDSILMFVNIYPNEPISEIILALHDGLAFKDSWISLDSNSYKDLHRILKESASIDQLTDQMIGKAIVNLEKAGLNTTPILIEEPYSLEEGIKRHVERSRKMVEKIPPEERTIISKYEAEVNKYDWLKEAIKFEKLKQNRKAIFTIHKNVDSMLKAGEFETIDKLLQSLDVNKLSTRILLSFLTITYVSRQKLPFRMEFFNRASKVITERGEMEEGLLDGLGAELK